MTEAESANLDDDINGAVASLNAAGRMLLGRLFSLLEAKLECFDPPPNWGVKDGVIIFEYKDKVLRIDPTSGIETLDDVGLELLGDIAEVLPLSLENCPGDTIEIFARNGSIVMRADGEETMLNSGHNLRFYAVQPPSYDADATGFDSDGSTDASSAEVPPSTLTAEARAILVREFMEQHGLDEPTAEMAVDLILVHQMENSPIANCELSTRYGFVNMANPGGIDASVRADDRNRNFFDAASTVMDVTHEFSPHRTPEHEHCYDLWQALCKSAFGKLDDYYVHINNRAARDIRILVDSVPERNINHLLQRLHFEHHLHCSSGRHCFREFEAFQKLQAHIATLRNANYDRALESSTALLKDCSTGIFEILELAKNGDAKALLELEQICCQPLNATLGHYAQEEPDRLAERLRLERLVTVAQVYRMEEWHSAAMHSAGKADGKVDWKVAGAEIVGNPQGFLDSLIEVHLQHPLQSSVKEACKEDLPAFFMGGMTAGVPELDLPADFFSKFDPATRITLREACQARLTLLPEIEDESTRPQRIFLENLVTSMEHIEANGGDKFAFNYGALHESEEEFRTSFLFRLVQRKRSLDKRLDGKKPGRDRKFLKDYASRFFTPDGMESLLEIGIVPAEFGKHLVSSNEWQGAFHHIPFEKIVSLCHHMSSRRHRCSGYEQVMLEQAQTLLLKWFIQSDAATAMKSTKNGIFIDPRGVRVSFTAYTGKTVESRTSALVAHIPFEDLSRTEIGQLYGRELLGDEDAFELILLRAEANNDVRQFELESKKRALFVHNFDDYRMQDPMQFLVDKCTTPKGREELLQAIYGSLDAPQIQHAKLPISLCRELLRRLSGNEVNYMRGVITLMQLCEHAQKIVRKANPANETNFVDDPRSYAVVRTIMAAVLEGMCESPWGLEIFVNSNNSHHFPHDFPFRWEGDEHQGVLIAQGIPLNVDERDKDDIEEARVVLRPQDLSVKSARRLHRIVDRSTKDRADNSHIPPRWLDDGIDVNMIYMG